MNSIWVAIEVADTGSSGREVKVYRDLRSAVSALEEDWKRLQMQQLKVDKLTQGHYGMRRLWHKVKCKGLQYSGLARRVDRAAAGGNLEFLAQSSV